MPKLGAALDFNQLEARNVTVHNLSAAPSAPVKGQLYFDTVANTLLWWDGTAWQSAKSIALTNDLGGTATAPTVVGLHLAGDTAINHKLTSLTDPTNPQDASTKNYVDTASQAPVQALVWKQFARAATTANITLSGTQTIDGVALNVGDRVLVKNQTTASGNGIYVVASGAWTRSLDMANWSQTVAAYIPVGPEGLANFGTIWASGANAGGILGTTSLSFFAIPSWIGYGVAPGGGLPANATLNSIATNNPATSGVGLNGQKIGTMADPTLAQDAATKNYVDNIANGIDAKQSVRAASTGANLTLSGTQTVDGVALIAGDRILVKDQTTASQNGIYVVAASGWSRSNDASTWAELPGAYTWVEVGTVNADSGWVCTVDQGGTLNTTAVTWTQFSGAAMITAGAGLTKTGNTIDIGAGNGIQVNADSIQANVGNGLTVGSGSIAILPGGVTNAMIQGPISVVLGGTGQTTAKGARETGLGAAGYYSNNATHGAGTTITISQATHGLRASRGIQVQAQDNTTGNVELPDISVDTSGNVTVTYAVSVAANSKLITCVG